MFDFSNIDSSEFERLCRDILERKYGVKFRTYASGPDGGIDITKEDGSTRIVVQCKHYLGSGFNSLKSALKAEIPKIDKIAEEGPLDKYIVCTSVKLTHKNLTDLGEMLKPHHMESAADIVDHEQLERLLETDEYSDIVAQHVKLWASSGSVLQTVLNNEDFIDTTAFRAEIEHQVPFFVETDEYYQCLALLSYNKPVLIVGGPGVGKTVTTAMLCLSLLKAGYILHTSSANDLGTIKKTLSRTDTREAIVLDDCFGHAYFNISESRADELQALLRYCTLNPSKRVILNSRITIYNSLQNKSPNLHDYLIDRRPINEFMINMDNMSLKDKTRLYVSSIRRRVEDDSIRNWLLRTDNYHHIIEHPDFNPRLWDYILSPKRNKSNNLDEFSSFVDESFVNQQFVWQDEFNNNMTGVDRTVMYCLQSLSDDAVQEQQLQSCCTKIFLAMPVDHTCNNYLEAIKRLTNSLLVRDKRGSLFFVSAISQSVTDYVRSRLRADTEARNWILENALYVEQVERLDKKCLKKYISDNPKLHSIDSNRDRFIDVEYTVEYNLLDKSRSEAIDGYFKSLLEERNNHKICNFLREDKVFGEFFNTTELPNYFDAYKWFNTSDELLTILDQLTRSTCTIVVKTLQQHYSKVNNKEGVKRLQSYLEHRIDDAISYPDYQDCFEQFDIYDYISDFQNSEADCDRTEISFVDYDKLGQDMLDLYCDQLNTFAQEFKGLLNVNSYLEDHIHELEFPDASDYFDETQLLRDDDDYDRRQDERAEAFNNDKDQIDVIMTEYKDSLDG